MDFLKKKKNTEIHTSILFACMKNPCYENVYGFKKFLSSSFLRIKIMESSIF